MGVCVCGGLMMGVCLGKAQTLSGGFQFGLWGQHNCSILCRCCVGRDPLCAVAQMFTIARETRTRNRRCAGTCVLVATGDGQPHAY